MITGILTTDFHYDVTYKGDLQLELIDYPLSNLIVFRLTFVGQTETVWLERMHTLDYPELLELYDFDNKQWVESELSCFWSGLQICLA